MQQLLKIDRSFVFLRGSGLLAFADRILRNMNQNVNVPNCESTWRLVADTRQAIIDASGTYYARQKDKTQAIREREAALTLALEKMADHIQTAATCKSDVYTTGYRPHSEHRSNQGVGKDHLNRRRLKVSARISHSIQTGGNRPV
jgi:hypothetical protein